MRLRNIPGAREAVAADSRCFDTPEETKGRWQEIFGNDHPLMVEVGMGKGRFIIENALRHPEINYIGIERYESVIIRALQKLDRMNAEELKHPEMPSSDRAIKTGAPPNLRFLRMDAAEIRLFFEPRSIQRIYLNFSDPWPKDRHARRRLTSREFLMRFREILKDDGTIEFKTDNLDLFRFSLDEQAIAGWKLLYSTEDLHSDQEAMKNNIMTEYEQKFSARGNKICKYSISKR
ncbi:MAG: tRNA (guanosine(46)-N7)-methyltransferase TrmB [Lachnospiraceae bacterium]|nr:tRNA (guanosine(46)-N7)-methyltransferase TrmB [Lachnospiraceae bacterium]